LSLRYCITDRTPLRAIAEILLAGVDLLQIREKHLSTRELAAHVSAVLQLANPLGARILVNDRADVAMACGAHGVHLRSGSISPAVLRGIVPSGFVIGVSCHSIADIEAAEGADFVVLAPIFETPGKGSPLGLRYLAQAVHTTNIPVIALGGITRERIPVCLRLGAAGVAGIRLFQEPVETPNLTTAVGEAFEANRSGPVPVAHARGSLKSACYRTEPRA
jgi:thiamine-phosphate pyrophosphorylase